MKLPEPCLRVSALILLVSTLVLVVLGLTMTLRMEFDESRGTFISRHTLWAGVGCLLMGVMAMTDYSWCLRKAWPVFMLGMFLLMLVYVLGIGQSMNGARRWLRLGPCLIQPSEVAKLVTVVMVASLLSARDPTEKLRWLAPYVLTMVAVALILCEVDFAGAWILAAVGLRLLMRSRVPWRVMSVLYALPLLSVAMMIWTTEHGPARLSDKMLRLLGLTPYPHASPFAALTSADWTMRDLGQGSVVRYHFAGSDRDYLLARIGGNLGWPGLICTGVLLIALVVSGRHIARGAMDRFGGLLGYGLVGLIEWQVIWHVGANLGFLSHSTPLPFMSDSGTNLCAMLTAVGMLISIVRTQERDLRSRSRCSR